MQLDFLHLKFQYTDNTLYSFLFPLFYYILLNLVSIFFF
nr:MAG TPA: hypothetical protein [Caudoviricetes sp.]